MNQCSSCFANLHFYPTYLDELGRECCSFCGSIIDEFPAEIMAAGLRISSGHDVEVAIELALDRPVSEIAA